MRVLFVDDDALIRKLAEFAFGRIGGMTVITAANGQEALAVVDTEHPDVIVIDFMMPGMNGDEVLEILQSCPDTREIPVVFLSGIDDPDQVRAWIDSGATGCLAKPFDPTTLAKELEEMLRVGSVHDTIHS